MIAIVDYGVGNLASVANMFRRIDIRNVLVTRDEEKLMKAEKILLPGVGSFDGGMGRLLESGLVPLLNKRVLEDKVPVLGICLGMQMLTRRSEEGSIPGLGWLEADTVKLNPDPELNLKVPHMGWDYIRVKRSNPLVGMNEKARFYFVHSFHVKCDNEADVLATSDFGGEFTCMVQNGNIFGAQFHPEKSLKYGMQLLSNFARMPVSVSKAT